MRSPAIAAVFLMACAPEPFEAPMHGDSDGDGLDDALELRIGSNPFEVDTDGDTYTDYDEWTFGSDPLDRKDRIYKGRWPYWGDKDSLDAPPRRAGIARRQQLPRLVLPDHNGERVDLYDWAGDDQEHEWILIDVCAEWCPPCLHLADWVSGNSIEYDEDYLAVRDAVDDGRLGYMTILTEDISYEVPEVEDLERYHDAFSHDRIPVLSDPDSYVEEHIVGRTGGWPSFILVRASDMMVFDIGYMLIDGLEAAKAELEE